MDSLLGILLVIAIVVVDSLQSRRRKKSQQNHLLPTEQPDPSAQQNAQPPRPHTQKGATASRLPSLEEAIELMKKQWLAPFEASSHDDDENDPSGTDPVPKEDPPPERAPKEKPPMETPARHSGMPIEEPGRPATLAHAGHDRAGHPLHQAPASVRDLKEPSLAIGNDNPLATLKATPLSARRVGMKGRRLTREDWRKGIIMAAIFGPPRGDQPYELP
ncbi:MAG: hypothetical protein E6Z03_00155 [Negativicoccus succinicivorans]|uniref:hypothetical protein n=1 Tax=Negativicoccus succinicivorans TaxID=620903 RepID=UPI002582A732|nr:hypothetical protein [Negativicoccus succinicivorans]MDU5594356.1 hypothetical protein [Escherichia coli]MDU2643496.1 hypothetical protein [Negativicoccus succinicivorans]MDU2929233.1 hypothetical protein [Negativicoccus succinicivorans]MDU4558583.1 hypothetical protein [Negativicoccus succinicivorans]MDU4575808.1 hypothetical protein [Negativicoccus succinicivorans]